MVWTAASSRRRPALSAIYYPTALMWRSKSGENCKKRPCSRLWSMLITKYYADHRELHCWSQGNTMLMIEKYAADQREIFWSILIREKYGSPAIPTQGGFFLIHPSHPMKQSSDPITILIATMMMMTWPLPWWRRIRSNQWIWLPYWLPSPFDCRTRDYRGFPCEERNQQMTIAAWSPPTS